ncbi:MAG: aromatic ring-hydroxylating dioxygenase subunit alpha, partial [Pseudomonadota bacterium]
MNRTTEIQLAEELLALHRGKSAFLADAVTTAPVEAYTDTRRFRRERAKIMRTALHPAVHAGELPERGSFLRRDVAGLPVLFTRDGDGAAHAFLNVCRHRGTRLVDEERGCKRRFSCPYHAWTYSNRGELLGLPHAKQGFPDADRDSLGLKRLGCVEKYGWLWVTAATDESPDVEGRLAGLAGSLDWLGADNYRIVHSDEILCSANWKLLVEGGIEAYHFRVAHRKTIGPYFLDNLSTDRCFGPHMRSVLAKRSLPQLAEQPVESWRLLDHAQVL